MEGCGRAAPAEDAVRYRLFAVPGAGGEERLRRCADGIAVRLAPLLAAYIWQRQRFRLRYVPPCGERGAGPWGDRTPPGTFCVWGCGLSRGLEAPVEGGGGGGGL